MTVVIKEKQSRRHRKKLDVRARIIATALKLFSRHGFDEVTVEHIADVADIGKGTIYNYFDTKEDIVVAFMVDVERKVQSGVQRFATSSKRLDTLLCEFVLFQLRLKQPYHPFVKVFLGQIVNPTEHSLPYILEMQKLIDPPMETLFQTLRRRHAIRNDVEIPELIFAFKTLQLGITALWAMEGPPFHKTEKVLRLQMKLFAEGLKSK
jgi:AcrR family transcriptional regulator